MSFFNLCRSTIIYLKIMLRMGASTSNRKFTRLKSVWNLYINPKIKVLLVEKKPGEVCIGDVLICCLGDEVCIRTLIYLSCLVFVEQKIFVGVVILSSPE